jgi:hypothetical protein
LATLAADHFPPTTANCHEEYERDFGRFCTATFGLLSRDGDSFVLTLASGGRRECIVDTNRSR